MYSILLLMHADISGLNISRLHPHCDRIIFGPWDTKNGHPGTFPTFPLIFFSVSDKKQKSSQFDQKFTPENVPLCIERVRFQHDSGKSPTWFTLPHLFRSSAKRYSVRFKIYIGWRNRFSSALRYSVGSVAAFEIWLQNRVSVGMLWLTVSNSNNGKEYRDQ